MWQVRFWKWWKYLDNKFYVWNDDVHCRHRQNEENSFVELDNLCEMIKREDEIARILYYKTSEEWEIVLV